MGKLALNKKQKKEALLNAAFHLFITNGMNKTTISDIVKEAGVAKGTFYLYFKDKYEIRNELISHKSSQLFSTAHQAMLQEDIEIFEDKIIFIADYIINELIEDKPLLKFLAKNLSWGVFKSALFHPATEDDIDFYQIYLEMIEHSGGEVVEPEIMLFLIIELLSATVYDSVLHHEPVSVEKLKPHLYDTIRYIVKSHSQRKDG